jgi:hypothetical protein
MEDISVIDKIFRLLVPAHYNDGLVRPIPINGDEKLINVLHRIKYLGF